MRSWAGRMEGGWMLVAGWGEGGWVGKMGEKGTKGKG